MAVGALMDVILSAGGVHDFTQWLKYSVIRSSTARAIDKLIVFTIESGCVTGLLSFVNMICLITMPHNWIWLAIHIILPKVYADAFLASLNGRTGVWSSDVLSTSRVIPLSSSGGARSAEADASVIELQEPAYFDMAKSSQRTSYSRHEPTSTV
ncbi:hypothetical protein BDV98DRAFT_608870 [Pterulicium gracile]|uniref:DUF6534 domain-containing protein n=1 Tax=Pterulicium gracile TaxID=1884261 RepID=A0A5C3Q1V9_9AGAR|nr:hypothetical protein BDV98DRAFT_608870 [Pterula gracilis]